jgi:hypothetical protein
MDEFSFSPRFLQELAEWEQTASPKDRAQLDHILAATIQNPTLAGRAPSFYDPIIPSYLYRLGTVLIHFRVTTDQVEFLNLFFRRS